MLAGQVNPIISIVIDNNNDNDNIPLNGFQHQFLKWGRRKIFTSTAASQLQDLCREVQLFTCGRPRDHGIVTKTARDFESFTSSAGNAEIRFHYLRDVTIFIVLFG